MIILDGKKVAAAIRQDLAEEIAAGRAAGLRAPGLAVILAGDNPASQVYVRNKQKACAEAGINSIPYILPGDCGEAKLLAIINGLNHKDDIDGILLQLPVPDGINTRKCLLAIDPQKDVDGFHPENMGRLVLGLPGFKPCTPAGIMKLLEAYNMDLNGKKAVVVGRSDIVGKPLAVLLAQKNANATVTLCHSGTEDLQGECRKADYLFLAMGRPKTITGGMVREGCVIVDVGINRTENGLCGDADFESVSQKARAITPVPGGVGPMTIAMLLANTVESWKARTGQLAVDKF